jgi:LPS sulfotransferase NodH
MVSNLYILTSARSGSTYFCQVLNNTGLFAPALVEHYLPKDIDLIPRNNKLLINKYNQSEYLTLGDVKKKYPDTKFIYLQRRDVIACTVSHFLAKSTIMYFHNSHRVDLYEKIFGQDHKKLHSMKNRLGLMETYFRTKGNVDIYVDIMKKYDIEALPVYYEDILEDGEREFLRVFKYLDIDVSLVKEAIAQNTLKIQRDMSQDIYMEAGKLLRKLLDKQADR